jgi:hypothetical protein
MKKLTVLRSEAATAKAAESQLQRRITRMLKSKEKKERVATAKAQQLNLPFDKKRSRYRGVSLQFGQVEYKLRVPHGDGGYKSRASAQEAIRNFVRARVDPLSKASMLKNMEAIMNSNPALQSKHPRGTGLGRKEQVLQSASTKTSTPPAKQEAKPQPDVVTLYEICNTLTGMLVEQVKMATSLFSIARDLKRMPSLREPKG